jgi:hypothetical protein
MIAFFVILAVLMVLVFAAGQWGRRPGGTRVVHVVDRAPRVVERQPVVVDRDPMLVERAPVVEEVVAAPTRRVVRRTTRYQ